MKRTKTICIISVFFLVSIVLLCSITVPKVKPYNNQEPFETSTVQLHNPKVKILSKAETDELIEMDSDGYFASLKQTDLDIRKTNSVKEYKSTSKQQFCTGEIDELVSKKLFHACEHVHYKLREHSQNTDYLFGISIESFLDIPWKFAIVCTEPGSEIQYENGFPHTRGDVIILPKHIIDSYSTTNQTKLCKLLIHEKVHVYQKKYPDIIQKFLSFNDFKKGDMRVSHQDPANPDLNEFRYSHKKLGLMFAQYKNDKPKTFADIQYAHQNDSSSEHPLEYMAYRFEEIIENPADQISLIKN